MLSRQSLGWHFLAPFVTFCHPCPARARKCQAAEPTRRRKRHQNFTAFDLPEPASPCRPVRGAKDTSVDLKCDFQRGPGQRFNLEGGVRVWSHPMIGFLTGVEDSNPVGFGKGVMRIIFL